jgi:DNA processing protein
MDLRDFLLRAHMSSGANQNVAVRVLMALANGEPPELSTLYACAGNQKMRTTMKQWLQSEEGEAALVRATNAGYLAYTDDNYPDRLREIAQPPLVLFYSGHLELLRQPTLAIVGARLATEYSAQVINQVVRGLPAETVIVSGLAAGADSMGHRAALGNHRGTIAVIGNGLNYYYPTNHKSLQQVIARDGLLLSEYPLGTKPMPYRFVGRNRIIAGLCHALMVTEAQDRSGSLITARMALDSGRDVYALPNRFDEPLGIGTNKLIEEGAIPVLPDTKWTNIHYFD